MNDHFATLGVPRRPWLDPESLKEKFHNLSASVHPDRVHGAAAEVRRVAGDRYSDLNAAYQCLRDPKARLQHLIVLEKGGKPGDSNRIPDDLLRWFEEIGGLLRLADSLIAEKGLFSAPVLKVQFMEQALPLMQKLNELQSSLKERLHQLDSQLQRLDDAWEESGSAQENRDGLVQEAEHLYHLYGFIERWRAQLHERAFQLTL